MPCHAFPSQPHLDPDSAQHPEHGQTCATNCKKRARDTYWALDFFGVVSPTRAEKVGLTVACEGQDSAPELSGEA